MCIDIEPLFVDPKGMLLDLGERSLPKLLDLVTGVSPSRPGSCVRECG